MGSRAAHVFLFAKKRTFCCRFGAWWINSIGYRGKDHSSGCFCAMWAPKTRSNSNSGRSVFPPTRVRVSGAPRLGRPTTTLRTGSTRGGHGFDRSPTRSRNLTVQAGDVIQSTCIFDSQGRTEAVSGERSSRWGGDCFSSHSPVSVGRSWKI